GADHCVSDAGVAGGGVEDRAARAEQAFPLAIDDHGGRGAILYGPAGVLPFGFGVQLDAAVSALEATQPEERGIADEIEGGPRRGKIRGPGDRKRHFSYPTCWVCDLSRLGPSGQNLRPGLKCQPWLAPRVPKRNTKALPGTVPKSGRPLSGPSETFVISS